MIEYKYYWNDQKDAQGRNTAMMDGYKEGDPLTLMYSGSLLNMTTALTACDDLFYMFNADGARPADYRGPSMSIGSVIQLGSKAYAVESVGFREVDISRSPIQGAMPSIPAVMHDSVVRFGQLLKEANVMPPEQLHALERAQTLWGEGAWVLDQSNLSTKMFIVSSGKGITVHYGEGESWDEAFKNAGSSLFPSDKE